MNDVPSHARPSSSGRVKNKAPARVQITAEQLLREAWERKESGPVAIPKQQIADKEELLEYQRTERKQYEMRIVRNRSHTPLWIRYARWEESQDEFTRARSVWERAIDNDYRNPAIWLGYAEMEMRHRFVNHARNVLDRAVALLPRVDQLWLKYAHFEEMLDQIDLSRLVYSRWLKWMPGPSAFFAFIRFELRHGAVERARSVYNELVRSHRTSHSYIKFAKFEERQGEFGRARAVYERGSEELAIQQQTAGLFLSFAKFEERRKQPARARAIYKYALDRLGKDETEQIERALVSFEKQQGEREMLDDLLVRKKRATLEEAVKANRHDYDSWFDLVQLEEAYSDVDKIRETYERAVSNVPLSKSKSGWGRYIYLWISYAVWEELWSGSARLALSIYARGLGSIPDKHRKFSFSELWILYAEAHIRGGDICGARKAFGNGIGVLGEDERVYRKYLDMERGVGEFGRVRKIYENWIGRQGLRGDLYMELAEFEMELGEDGRASGVLNVAVGIEGLVGKEMVWERLIEMEMENGKGNTELVGLFERLVGDCAGFGRAWVLYGKWVVDVMGDLERGRSIFERGVREVKGRVVEGGGSAEDLVEVVRGWVEVEEDAFLDGESESERVGRIERVRRKMPKRVRRKRKVVGLDGREGGWEEYSEFVVDQEGADGAEEEERKRRLLQAARAWKEGLDAGVQRV